MKRIQLSSLILVCLWISACGKQVVEFPLSGAEADVTDGDLAVGDSADASDTAADTADADVGEDALDAADIAPDSADVADANDIAPDAADVADTNDIAPDAADVADANDIAPDAVDVADTNDIAPDAVDVADTNDIAPDAADVPDVAPDVQPDIADTADVQPDAAQAPTVTLTNPADLATDVTLGVQLTAKFSESMTQSSVTELTFTLMQDATPVTGVVTYDDLTHIATFVPVEPLLLDLPYQATITTGVKSALGVAMLANFEWSFKTGDATLLKVTATNPVDLAKDVTLAVQLTATFNKAMQPGSINDLTFTLMQDATPVTGLVTYDDLTHTARFLPLQPLSLDLAYQATITTGATDSGGKHLLANYGWTFKTGDATPAMVLSTTPTDTALNVPITTHLTALFNKAMDGTTINDQTFIVMQGATQIFGQISYNQLTKTATFVPNNPLALDLSYQATITTGALDSGGKPLSAGYGWTFQTSACGQDIVALSSAGNFAVLAGSTVTNTGPTSVTGDLGVFAGTAVTGFPPGGVIGAIHAGDTTAQLAMANLTVAYNDAAGRTLCAVTVNGNLGGQTLPPGLYKSTSSLEISSGDLTLDAQGDSAAVFIFQMASTLTTTDGRQVFLTGGAKATNVFWQVGSSATIGTTSAFFGTIMADQSITMKTGATLTGRLLARIGAVTLDSNTIVLPPL